LNTALQTGATTIEDLQTMFANADLSMPEYHLASVPHTSITDNTSTITRTGPLGIPVTYTEESSTTTTTWSQVPYFGDTPPEFEKTTTPDGQVEWK
jgi:hypothetical protein